MKPVDVIITLYVPTQETLALAKRCILSVLLRTDHPHRLLLVDDKSPLGEIRDFVTRVAKRFGRRNSIEVIFNEVNLGFVKTANMAMQHGDSLDHDIVMLNNDTEVTSGWLGRMVGVAYRDRKIATVTPLSNNATIASFPKMYDDNVIPSGLSHEDVARIVRRVSPGMAPEIPTGHGYCMFVKRSVLREVGYFDTVAFGKGYGEENDLCCRCLEFGYYHVLDDTTYVYHKGEASFQGSRDAVTGKAFQTLIERYPFFKDVVIAFETKDPIRSTREAIGKALRNELWSPGVDEIGTRTRVLLLNAAGGKYNGLRRYSEDLSRILQPSVEVLILESDGCDLRLFDSNGTQIFSTRLQERITWNSVYTNLAYKRIVSYLMTELDIDLVQVNCFEGHTFDIVDLADELSIPIIYVAHDFELICPTHFLVGPHRTLCTMCSHTKEEPNCLERNPFLMSGTGSTEQLLRFRNYLVREVIPKLAVLICPSHEARKRLEEVYPGIIDKLEIVPHGVDVESRPVRIQPSAGATVRVATVGAMHELKGLHLLRKIVASTEKLPIQYHHFGPSAEHLAGVHFHGTYEPSELPALLVEHRIDLVMMLSLLPETFGYTLSEVALGGVPVLAQDAGALPERVRQFDLGIVVPYNDAEAFIAHLKRLSMNRQEIGHMKAKMRTELMTTFPQMAASYLQLYSRYVASPRRRNGLEEGSGEQFLRITAPTSQMRIDELVAAKGHYEMLCAQLGAQLHEVRTRCHVIETSLPVRVSRRIKRVPWLEKAFRLARGCVPRKSRPAASST